MDGKNSTGRKVSLLNDNSVVPALQRLPSFSVASFSAHSRSPSSASSTPSLSPQTPQLARSESSDSRGLPPSPQTPHFSAFNPVHHHHQIPPPLYLLGASSFSKMDDQGASMYPPIPEAAGVMPYPMPAASSQAHVPVFRASQSPTSEAAHLSNASNATASSANASASASASASKQVSTKKNQYPCPLAKQIGCTDFFTTSGHAARHAKKHTGKKDAFCPECNKAFTRKDNMEQHRRTHQSVRGPAKAGGDNRVKKPVKPSSTRKSDKSLSAPLENAVAQFEEQQQQLAQQSMMASGPYFINAEPVQALPHPVPAEFASRPPLYRASYPGSLDFVPPTASMVSDPNDLPYNYPSPGLSNGLDTLALAASDHRRMSQEDSS
ncbi:hypothetical protein MBLNU459_g6909t1 [Dothideomycetes sp. NU459]